MLRKATLLAATGAAILGLTACLPSSQRRNTEALLPADSLSRQIAAAAPVDTLLLEAIVHGPEDAPMELPSSLLWLPSSAGGRLHVVDTRRNSFHELDEDFQYVAEWRLDGLSFPYAAGIRGDTLVVLNRGENRLNFIRQRKLIRSIALPEESIASALVDDSTIIVKRADEKAVRLLTLSESGAPAENFLLPGPYWRHIGFLRSWGDSLLSLSGYRPVIDVLMRDAADGAATDSLVLLGFDSTQLMRSNQFLLGEVDEPPLLISSAIALENRLYVVNLRADRIRIDVYDRMGRIERALVFGDVESLPNAFPVDIAVRRDGADLLFALAMQDPGGLFRNPGGYLLALRWRGEGTPPHSS